MNLLKNNGWKCLWRGHPAQPTDQLKPLPTPLGPLPLQSSGFMLTEVPLVMGEQPTPRIAKAEANLVQDRVRTPPPVPCLRAGPPYCPRLCDLGPGLCLRGHAALRDAPPPHAAGVDKVLTRVLRVPRNVPWPLLLMPVAGGGFGFPHLYSRMRLRHVQGFLLSMERARPRERLRPRPPRPLEGPGRPTICFSIPWPRRSWRYTSFRRWRRSRQLWPSGCSGRTSRGSPPRR